MAKVERFSGFKANMMAPRREMHTPITKQAAKPLNGRRIVRQSDPSFNGAEEDSIPNLNPGGPREGGCVEGLRDHASLGGIGAVGVPGRVGEDRRRGREESLDFVHFEKLF